MKVKIGKPPQERDGSPSSCGGDVLPLSVLGGRSQLVLEELDLLAGLMPLVPHLVDGRPNGHAQAVEVDPRKGEQWFCTEEEAQAAGWVKSASCDNNPASLRGFVGLK